MSLLIAEELLLLAYSPDGTAHGKGTELDCALGGSLLVELVLAGHAELVGSKVQAVGSRPPPDRRELVEILTEVAGKQRRPKDWVKRWSGRTRRRLLAGLVEQGVLADEPYRVLGVFTRHRFPAVDVEPRTAVLGRLRAAVLDGRRPEQRTAALAAMISAAGLQRRIFDPMIADDGGRVQREGRRAVKRRLAEIADGDWAAEAVRKAIRDVRAATAAAVTAAASSANSSGSGS